MEPEKLNKIKAEVAAIATSKKDAKRKKRSSWRDEAYAAMGMKKVRGALGGTYYEGIEDLDAGDDKVTNLVKAASRVLELIESGDWPLPEGFHESEVNWLRSAVNRFKPGHSFFGWRDDSPLHPVHRMSAKGLDFGESAAKLADELLG
jgi:hypothetical protein